LHLYRLPVLLGRVKGSLYFRQKHLATATELAGTGETVPSEG
jgi:hypothetical protein